MALLPARVTEFAERASLTVTVTPLVMMAVSFGPGTPFGVHVLLADQSAELVAM